MNTQEVSIDFDITLAQPLAEEQSVSAALAVVKDGELLCAKGDGYLLPI